MPKKVAVISGFNGFIGTNLGFVLKQIGYEVAPLPREVLSNPLLLNDFMDKVEATHVFHLASYGNHSKHKDDNEIVATNYLKTWFLLDASYKNGVKNFINFSTSSVYGQPGIPLSEDLPVNPKSMYAITKAGAEMLVNSFSPHMAVVNIRPFSVYGEYEAKFRLIPTIIDSIVNNKELTLYPDPVHDWIYIEDFLEGLIAVTDNIGKLNGKAINIGTGTQFTNKQVYDHLVSIAGKKPLSVTETPSTRENDTTKSWVADNSLLKSLGWTQKTPIKEGLEYTYKYYEKMFNLDKDKENLVSSDLKGIMDTMATKFGGGWQDIPSDKDIIV
jgi:nucleoside-diphosphate-sugar epimerase